MAYKVFEDFTAENRTADGSSPVVHIQADGAERIEMPDSSYIRDADMSRDGMDLVLETPEGTVVIDNYFAQAQPPALSAPNGLTLTPELVHSFTHSGSQYANAGSMNDASPVGAVQEISGEATVTRLDGTVETAGIGTPIYQGDVIETSEDGAVNIVFVDNTSFAVSEDARLAIDEYVFDPATQSGTSNFSVLKGVFVFTSGLIGRDDPDQVEIDTPSGSIGIRGTIIAGDVDTGEITVIEGAIVLRDFSGNSVTLASQFETAKFIPGDHSIEHIGTLSADNVMGKFMSVSTVAADLFSSIGDSAAETGQDNSETGSDSGKTDGTTDGNATSGDGASDSGAALDGASANDQMLNSTDIVSAGTSGMPKSAPLMTSGTTTSSTTTINTATIGTATDPLQPPLHAEPEPLAVTPFKVSIQKFSFSENTTGGPLVAHIAGQGTTFTNVVLTGASAILFNIVRVDANNFDIYLKPGISMDYEHPYELSFHAVNDSGQWFDDTISLAITNQIETAYLTDAEPNELFTASDNNNWSHNFGIDFFDPEGRIVSYQISGVPSVGTSGIASQNFDTGSGVLTLTFDGNVPDSSFSITVNALDENGNAISGLSKTVSFQTYDQTASGSTLTSGGEVYSGTTTDDSIAIASNNNTVLADGGNDTIGISGTGNLVNAGHGADTFTVLSSSTGNTLVAGAGNDTFDISDARNNFYGGEDNDTFNINTTTALSQLQSGSGLTLDGGSQNDLLHIGVGGNIDFSAMASGNIKNVEKISTDNGAANTVTLNYSDLVAMTDERNTLQIDMDVNDSITFDTQGHTFVALGTSGGYTSFTDGSVTLLVEQSGATTII